MIVPAVSTKSAPKGIRIGRCIQLPPPKKASPKSITRWVMLPIIANPTVRLLLQTVSKGQLLDRE